MGRFQSWEAISAVFYQAGREAIYLLTAHAKAEREDLTPADPEALTHVSFAAIKKGASEKLTMERTDLGREIETGSGRGSRPCSR